MPVPHKTRFEKKPYVNPVRGQNPTWLNAPDAEPVHSDTFAAQMDEVLDVASQVSRDEWPAEFLKRYGLEASVPEPLHSEVHTNERPDPKKAAELVRMDHPLDLGIKLREWLAQNGYRYRSKTTETDAADFLFGVIWFDATILLAIFRAMRVAWGLKWLWFIPRAEEWFGCNVTRYSIGAPAHPGDVAGHGTAAGATVAQILKLMPDLPGDVIRVLVMAGLHFASYRTLAGVHRQVENVRGFAVGWSAVRRQSFDKSLEEIRVFVPDLAV